MPQPMLDAGFKSIGDLWEPWCIAIEGEEVAAIAFAARLGARGAEIGVYTFPKFRSRRIRGGGDGELVIAGRASMAARCSTAPRGANRSSQRVTARLGLRMIGASFSIG